MWQAARIKSWWAKYRGWIIVLAVAYALLVLILVLLTGNPQNEPFRYQIF
jgi:hypothetical protein